MAYAYPKAFIASPSTLAVDLVRSPLAHLGIDELHEHIAAMQEVHLGLLDYLSTRRSADETSNAKRLADQLIARIDTATKLLEVLIAALEELVEPGDLGDDMPGSSGPGGARAAGSPGRMRF